MLIQDVVGFEVAGPLPDGDTDGLAGDASEDELRIALATGAVGYAVHGGRGCCRSISESKGDCGRTVSFATHLRVPPRRRSDERKCRSMPLANPAGAAVEVGVGEPELGMTASAPRTGPPCR